MIIQKVVNMFYVRPYEIVVLALVISYRSTERKEEKRKEKGKSV